MDEPDFVSKLFNSYRSYTDGFLPDPGAISDQANNLVIGLQELSLAKGVLDTEDAEKREEGTTPLTSDGDGFKTIKKA